MAQGKTALFTQTPLAIGDEKAGSGEWLIKVTRHVMVAVMATASEEMKLMNIQSGGNKGRQEGVLCPRGAIVASALLTGPLLIAGTLPRWQARVDGGGAVPKRVKRPISRCHGTAVMAMDGGYCCCWDGDN